MSPPIFQGVWQIVEDQNPSANATPTPVPGGAPGKTDFTLQALRP
jgi:hypothetical protein